MIQPAEMLARWNARAKTAEHLRTATPKADLAKKLRTLTALEFRAFTAKHEILFDFLADGDRVSEYWKERKLSLTKLFDRLRDSEVRLFTHFLEDRDFQDYEHERKRGGLSVIEEPMNWREVARERYRGNAWRWDLLPRPEKERITHELSN